MSLTLKIILILWIGIISPLIMIWYGKIKFKEGFLTAITAKIEEIKEQENESIDDR